MAPQVLVSLLDERQEFARLQARAAVAAGERAGLTTEVLFAENNAVVQIHQLFKRIHASEGERPVAIVVQSVTGEGLERVARNAVNAGIGWVLLNRRVSYVEELRSAYPTLPVAVVTPDQTEIGRIHGRQVRALAPEKGLLLYIQGPSDTSAARDRLRGAKEELAGTAYEWKILNADWTEAGATKVVAAWLRLKTVDGSLPVVIVAQNDAMAVGARQAALSKGVGWHDVPVLGCDGLPEHGQALVRAGDLAATVILPASAGAGVELAARWMVDGRQPSAELVLQPRSFPEMSVLRDPERTEGRARPLRRA